MTDNYTSWSLDKLRKERQKIDKAIKLAEKRDKKATLQQMAALAKKKRFRITRTDARFIFSASQICGYKQDYR